MFLYTYWYYCSFLFNFIIQFLSYVYYVCFCRSDSRQRSGSSLVVHCSCELFDSPLIEIASKFLQLSKTTYYNCVKMEKMTVKQDASKVSGLRPLRGLTHASEWFQKTHTGLVLSSVSSRVYSRVMGGSRVGGRGGPSLCTVALTMAVLMTGRLGSLRCTVNIGSIIASAHVKDINYHLVRHTCGS